MANLIDWSEVEASIAAAKVQQREDADKTHTPSSALENFRRVMKEREARRNSASNR
jgi:hypothetical protein